MIKPIKNMDNNAAIKKIDSQKKYGHMAIFFWLLGWAKRQPNPHSSAQFYALFAHPRSTSRKNVKKMYDCRVSLARELDLIKPVKNMDNNAAIKKIPQKIWAYGHAFFRCLGWVKRQPDPHSSEQFDALFSPIFVSLARELDLTKPIKNMDNKAAIKKIPQKNMDIWPCFFLALGMGQKATKSL